jgi:tetratricopeptide (TPR) repeat protein
MTNNTNGPQRVEDVLYDIHTLQGLNQFSEQFAKRHFGLASEFWRLVGFCMLIKRAVIDRIGGLDPRYGLGNFEDDDFCLRAYLAGFKAFIAHDCFVHHFGGRTFTGANVDYRQSMERNWEIFKEKWGIAKEIPNGPTYDVGLPPEGFDPDKHYIGLPHRKPKTNKDLSKMEQTRQLLEQADEYYQKDELKRAIDIYQQAIGQAPEEKSIYYAFAETLIAVQQFNEALEVLDRMPSEESDLKKMALMGYCKEGLQDYKGADTLADQVLAINPNFQLALNLKGIIAYRQKKFSAAEAYFKKSIEIEPGYGEPYTNLGILKWEANEIEDALVLFETGVGLSPNALDMVQIYHAAITTCGQYERGQRIFESILKKYPQNKRVTYFLIDALIKQEKYGRAMAVIEGAIIAFGIDEDGLVAALKVRKLIGPMALDRDTDSRPTVSLCMIVKNEEQLLANCLYRVKPIVDEMIVVDTGSTDNTKVIAEIFGARLFDFEWSNDFSEARNFSLSKASGKWIMVMDADEVISPDDYEEFERLVTASKNEPRGYSITTRNYTMRANTVGWRPNDGKYSREEAGIGWFPSEKVRLFPNHETIRFEYPVHELVDPGMQSAGISIEKCRIPVHHYGDLNRPKTDHKGNGYYEIGSQKLNESGKDVAALKELAVQAGNLERYEEAITYWQKLISLQPGMPEAFINMSSAHWQLGNYNKARSAAQKAVTLSPELKEAHFNLAISELFLGNLPESVEILEKLTEDHPDYPAALFMLSSAYCCDGSIAEAMARFQKLSQTPMGPGLCYAFTDLANRFVSAQKREYAISLLEAAIQCNISSEDIRVLKDTISSTSRPAAA